MDLAKSKAKKLWSSSTQRYKAAQNVTPYVFEGRKINRRTINFNKKIKKIIFEFNDKPSGQIRIYPSKCVRLGLLSTNIFNNLNGIH